MTEEEKQKSLEEEKQRIVKHIQGRLARGEPVQVIAGAFGESMGCEAVVEQILPTDGGISLKIYGCPYPYRGFPEKKAVDGLGLAKTMVAKYPEDMFRKSWFLRILFVFMAVFGRKQLIHMIRVFFTHVNNTVLEKISAIERTKMCTATHHLLGARDHVVRKLWDAEAGSEMLMKEHGNYYGKRELKILLTLLIEFFARVIEFDNAYRYRFQDVMENVNKDLVNKNVVKEVRRLFDILIERDNSHSQKMKWKRISTLAILAMRFSKDVRDFTREMLLTVDVLAVKMDDVDWYWSLDRASYNHRGLSHKERLEEQKKIEKEKNIIRISLQVVPRTATSIAPTAHIHSAFTTQ